MKTISYIIQVLALVGLMLASGQVQAQLFDQAKFPFVLRAPGQNTNQAGSFHTDGNDFVTVTNVNGSGNLYYGNDTISACAAVVVLDSAFNVKRTASFTIDSVIGLGGGCVNCSFGSNYGRHPTYSNGKAHFFVWPDSTKLGMKINGVHYARPAVGRQRAYIAMDTAGVIQTVDYFNFSPGNDYNMPAPFHVYHGDTQFVAFDYRDTLSITGQPQQFTTTTNTSIVIARNAAGQVFWHYQAPSPVGYTTVVYDLRAVEGGNVVLFHRHSISGGAQTYFLTEINGATGAEVWKDTMSTLILPKTKKINGEHYLIGQVTAANNSFKIGNAVVTAPNGLRDFVAKRSANGNWQVLFSQPHVLQFEDLHLEQDGSIVLVGSVVGNTTSGTATTTKFFGSLGSTVTGASDGFIGRLSPSFVPDLFEVYGGTQRYTQIPFAGGIAHNEAIGGLIKKNGKFYILGNFSIDIALGGFALFENSLPAGTTTIASSPFLASFTLASFDKDTIIGKLFHDDNGNNMQDPGEPGVGGTVVKLIPNKYAMTDSDGKFQFLVDPGTYNLTIPNPGYFSATPDTIAVTFTGFGAVDTSAKFALTFSDTVKDMSLTILGPSLLRANGTSFQLRYTNRGNYPTGGQVVYIRPSLFNIANTIPPPTSTSGDTLYWDYTNLAPLGYAPIIINGTGPSPVVNWIGASVFHTAYVTPTVMDTLPTNNYDTMVQVISAAYDPNNKVARPESGLSQPQVAAGEYIEYTINFQNTGNDTAFLVVLRDTLDHTKLNVESLEITGATHAVETILSDEGNLAFWFENILLPDSTTNLAGSQGAVHFRIKPLPHLLSGDTIYNTASIYFDGNPAIVTNTTATPITAQVQVVSLSESICVGDSIDVTYATSGLFGGGNSFSFILSNEYGSFINPTTLATVSGNTGGQIRLKVPSGIASSNYRLRVSATTAAVTSLPYINTLRLNAQPTVILNPVGGVCEDADAITLSAIPTGGSYSGAVSTEVFNPALLGVGTQTVYYTFTDAYGCVGSDTMAIEINSLPAVSVSNMDIELTLSSETVAVPSHQPAGGTFSGPFATLFDLTDPMAVVVTSADTGTYELYYTYVDLDGCEATDTAVVTLSLATGVNDVLNNYGLYVYPNPANGLLTVESTNGAANFAIYDLSGKQMLLHQAATGTTQVDISNLAPGMYFYQFINQDGLAMGTEKLVVE